MAWNIEWSDEAKKQLKKLDKATTKRIIEYINKNVAPAKNPYDFGKPLQYNQFGLWRYRVGDTRIICQIKNREMLILILRVGHRKNIYHH